MCKVTLPTVESFLLLYSLRTGCLTIFIWTVVSSRKQLLNTLLLGSVLAIELVFYIYSINPASMYGETNVDVDEAKEFRSLFCVFFYIVAILEVFTEKNAPIGAVLLANKKNRYTDESFNFVYYSYISLLLASAMLCVFCTYLAVGLYYDCSRPLEQYLICRFITWMVEVVTLFILCLEHKLLIGWYLGMLLFVILEFYAFIVVYSYYANVVDYENSKMCSMRSQTSCVA